MKHSLGKPTLIGLLIISWKCISVELGFPHTKHSPYMMSATHTASATPKSIWFSNHSPTPFHDLYTTHSNSLLEISTWVFNSQLKINMSKAELQICSSLYSKYYFITLSSLLDFSKWSLVIVHDISFNLTLQWFNQLPYPILFAFLALFILKLFDI